MSIYTQYPQQPPNNQEQISSSLDLFLKCSFLMILVSVVNLVTYYYTFNIPIIDYVDISEIGELFLHQLPNYLLLLIPLIVLLSGWSFSFNILLSFCLLLIHIITSDTNTQAKGQFLVICMAVYLPVALIFFTYTAKGDLGFFQKNPAYKWKLLVFMFTSSILLTSLDSMLNARLVKERYLYSGTDMVLDGNKIISDSTFYYVGRTKSFIFCYDPQKNRAKIYPADKLQEMVINTADPERFFNMSPEETCASISRGISRPVHNPVKP
ncbi:hypothetical protein [Chitinophaga pinensis]|uniref:Uncharacterized protein n=1 Tax=Chitinophaga pinensis (strain ATCC 43595 / DSM 2588 / LMG 13176 / NBRC 15968 / NCIMB 11800 / UQM 2034) TaxID=485918 RepID=A0A979G410_CHIPD|nr:hypothetical protein [Chitinophaga pinensis]ACU60464.1 hypothetical protein Cpin_2988 [Chitinophaga pinensis DSM 2588]